jgi:hypothetical protein
MVVEKIENRTQLKLKIMELHSRSFELETQIGHQLREMSYLIQPAMLLKRVVHDLEENPEAKNDLISAGKRITLNMLSNALFRSKRRLVSTIFFVALKPALTYFLKRRSEKRAAQKQLHGVRFKL